MNREKAIKIFKRLKENAPNEMHLETVGSAQELFDMAIQALSQEPTEKPMCDRNICISNEYNGIGCDKCIVNKEEQEPCDDAISREYLKKIAQSEGAYGYVSAHDIATAPSVTQKSGKWIPVSERLPENTYPVNITWVNHDPEPYYAIIKDEPFTATGHYCNGRWWWYSVTCQDYLDEYGHWDIDAMDDAIEVIAWMPLPKPYKPQESEDN